MVKIIWGKGFISELTKWKEKHPELIDVFKVKIEAFETNPFDRSLETHQLHGKLEGLWSISITRRYRVTFTFNKEKTIIRLIDIGPHKKVYKYGK